MKGYYENGMKKGRLVNRFYATEYIDFYKCKVLLLGPKLSG